MSLFLSCMCHEQVALFLLQFAESHLVRALFCKTPIQASKIKSLPPRVDSHGTNMIQIVDKQFPRHFEVIVASYRMSGLFENESLGPYGCRGKNLDNFSVNQERMPV